jgi:hypothetical protein
MTSDDPTNRARVYWGVPSNGSRPPPLYIWGSTVNRGITQLINQTIYEFIYILVLVVAIISLLRSQSSPLLISTSFRGVLGGPPITRQTYDLFSPTRSLLKARSRFSKRSSQPSRPHGWSTASTRTVPALAKWSDTLCASRRWSCDLSLTVRAHIESTLGRRSPWEGSGCARW